MTFDSGVLVLAALLALGLLAALAVIADRSARATAWRQIALERRWDNDLRHRERHSDSGE